jgi:Tfp pilus assembly protein PilF
LTEAHPDAVAPRLALAQVLVTAGEQGQAKEQLEKVLQIDPENVPAGLALARFAGAEGDLERAERMLVALDDAAADNADILELRGDVAAAAGQLDEAGRFYRKVLQQDPTGTRSIKLAALERRAGKPDYLSTLQVWLADHPDDVAVRLAMADARLTAQDNAAAREEYERIITISPDNVVARNNLAWLLWQSGDVSAALPHIKTALEHAPESPQVQDTAGIVFLAAGDAERAVALLRKAAEASPEDATILYHLAQALHAIGEFGQARQVLEQVLGNGSLFPERQQAEAFLKQLNG